MKTMKRFSAILIAVLLMVSMMAVPASAAAGGTLTVTGTTGVTYKLYKMFDVESAGTNLYKYKVTSEWADFASQNGVSNYIEVVNGYVFWKKNTTSESDGAALAALAKQYVDTKTVSTSGSVKVGESNNSVTVDEDGYYLMVPDNDSACGVQLLAGGATKTITEKTSAPGLPNVVKKVQEDSTSVYVDRNTAQIGETINFQTTITAAAGASNYVLHDVTDEHFTFISVGNITRGGNTMTEGTDYTVTVGDACGDGCSFHVEFSKNVCSSLAKEAKLVVHYTAKLNQSAAELTTENKPTDHTNTTWLTHTAENVKTNEDSTTTQTYQITVKKVDQIGTVLAGAGFKLKDNVGKFYQLKDGVVSWVDDAGNATEYVTGNDGIITFIGLDAENFTLVESTVPGGYTGSTDIAVSTKGDAADNTIGENTEVTVTNTLGTALPETGGIGTTIFYAVGGVLVLGALVLLVTKKRVGQR